MESKVAIEVQAGLVSFDFLSPLSGKRTTKRYLGVMRGLCGYAANQLYFQWQLNSSGGTVCIESRRQFGNLLEEHRSPRQHGCCSEERARSVAKLGGNGRNVSFRRSTPWDGTDIWVLPPGGSPEPWLATKAELLPRL